MPDEELNRDIPVLVRKYIPGINRGLSWAKYSKEKSEGTNMKSEAFSEIIGFLNISKDSLILPPQPFNLSHRVNSHN